RSCRYHRVPGEKRFSSRPPSGLLAALDSQVDLHPLVILLDDSVIFSQGMSLPAVRQQNALQIGMTIEADTEHVVHFALQPVCRRPDLDRAGHDFAVGDQRLHPNPLVTSKGVQNPDHIELLLALRIMQGRYVYAIIEFLLIAQNVQDLWDE